MEEDSGWSKATTYTLIKRCIGKGAIERSEPNFVCRPLIEKKDIQALETESFLQKMFNGAADQLIVSLLSSRKLSKEEIKALKEIINELE
jgi:predicted transcriptional regulator